MEKPTPEPPPDNELDLGNVVATRYQAGGVWYYNLTGDSGDASVGAESLLLDQAEASRLGKFLTEKETT